MQSVVKNVYSQSMKKYNVFISYARVDDAKNSDNLNPIDDITSRLDQAGLSYWIDREGKYVGESYLDEIGKGISSSEVLIFVSSKNSLNSDWVVQELSLAREKHKKIYQICLDNFLSKKYSIQLALAGTDKVEYFDAKSREKRMSDLIEIVQNYLREVEEEQKRIEEQKRQEKEEKERQKRAEQERLKRAEQERLKKLQSEKESLTRRLTHLIGRVDCEMKEMVDLDKKLGTEFDGWNKCPICGDDRRDSSREYCETCGWFFVTPKEYLISKERENYKERLQLSRANWAHIQSQISSSQDSSLARDFQPKQKTFLPSFWKKWLFPVAACLLVALAFIFWPRGGGESAGGGELTDSLAGTINGHGYVDLGLSVKWATCNMGASSPEDYGDYFAWGETRAKSEYTEENSVTWEKSFSDISGNSQYDAARARWGGSWRLPTKKEWGELKSKCTWTWTSQGGHRGYKVTGPNGKSIFLPAAGCRYGASFNYVGEYGYYWGSSPYESYTQCAYYLRFDSSNHGVYWDGRDCGRSVRPVSELLLSGKHVQGSIITDFLALQAPFERIFTAVR